MMDERLDQRSGAGTNATGTDRQSDHDLRRRAVETYDQARDSVGRAGRKTEEAIADAPLIALAGGLAVGAVLATLLPRSRREEELLRPVGNRLRQGAKVAADAARDAGTSRLDELGLTKDAGSDALRRIVDGASDAAKTSAKAAAEAVKKKEQATGRQG